MMRLLDPRSGEVTEVRPARRLLRLAVAGPPGRGTLSDLRAFVTGDLIRRNAERQRLSVDLAWDGADDATRADCAALGLRPPETASSGGAADLEVRAAGGGDGPARPVRCGAVLLDGREVSPEAPAGLADLNGVDPLALRLAFLGGRYAEPLALTRASLAEAAAELGSWRHQVATWATHPSRPPSAGHVARVTTAFDDDLDAASALAALTALAADPDIPAGAKFETLAHLDQLLGLELASEVGKV
jgi:hypothetical protein